MSSPPPKLSGGAPPPKLSGNKIEVPSDDSDIESDHEEKDLEIPSDDSDIESVHDDKEVDIPSDDSDLEDNDNDTKKNIPEIPSDDDSDIEDDPLPVVNKKDVPEVPSDDDSDIEDDPLPVIKKEEKKEEIKEEKPKKVRRKSGTFMPPKMLSKVTKNDSASNGKLKAPPPMSANTQPVKRRSSLTRASGSLSPSSGSLINQAQFIPNDSNNDKMKEPPKMLSKTSFIKLTTAFRKTSGEQTESTIHENDILDSKNDDNTFTKSTNLTISEIDASIYQKSVQQDGFISASITNAILKIQDSIGRWLSEFLRRDSYETTKQDPTLVLTLASECDSWGVYSLEVLAKCGYANEVVASLFKWLPKTTSRGGIAISSFEEMSNDYTFNAFIHKIEGYKHNDSNMKEWMQVTIENIVTEILAAVTSHAGGSGLSVEIGHDLAKAAIEGLLRPARNREDLFIQFRQRRIQNWGAILGNLTPDHGPIVLEILNEHIDPNNTLGLNDEQLIILSTSTRRMNLDVGDVNTRTKLIDVINNLIKLMQIGFSKKKRKGPALIAKTLGFIEATDDLLQGCNFFETNIANILDDESVSEFYRKLEELYRYLDSEWNPRKSQDSDLGPAANLLMSTILTRCQKNFYGSQLEQFLVKRILKYIHTSDQKKRANSFDCIFRLLRGPGYRVKQSKLITNLPKPSVKFDDSIERRGGAYVKRKHLYECVMPAFEKFENVVFRPESLTWIQEKLFTKAVKKKMSDMIIHGPIATNILLGLYSNSMSLTFIKGVLDYPDHKSLDFFLIGVRASYYILDPRFKFMEHASKTRLAASFDLGLEPLRQELSEYLSHILNGFLGRTLELIGLRREGKAELQLQYQDIFDEIGELTIPPMPDIVENLTSAAKGNAEKKLRARVLSLTIKCLPFLDFDLIVIPLIRNALLHHANPAISKEMMISLQRTMMHNPDLRPRILEELLLSIEVIHLEKHIDVLTLLSMVQGLLRLWTRFITDGLDGRTRLAIAKDVDVVERRMGGHYPAWTARSEAVALLSMCHTEELVRSSGLEILHDLLKLRNEQFQLIASLGLTEDDFQNNNNEEKKDEELNNNNKKKSKMVIATTAVPEHTYCVGEFLEEQENDIVQRSLHRFMLLSAGGDEQLAATSFAASSPSLKKVSKISSTLWFITLPEIAHRVLTYAHPSVVEETRRELYVQLLAYTQSSKEFEKKIPNKKLWSTELVLLLSLAKGSANLTGEHLSMEEHGSGRWSLGSYADPLEKLSQYLTLVWPLILEKTGDEWGVRIETAIQACSGFAIAPIAQSLLTWYHGLKDQKKRAVAPNITRLFRILSEGSDFVPVLAENYTILKMFLELCTSGMIMNPTWLDKTGDGTYLLDIALLIDRVCSGAIESHYRYASRMKKLMNENNNEKSNDNDNDDDDDDDIMSFEERGRLSSVFMAFDSAAHGMKNEDPTERPPIWSEPERNAIYSLLRHTHSWPAPGQFQNMPPSYRPRVHLTDRLERSCQRAAAKGISKLLQMGTTLRADDVEKINDELKDLRMPIEIEWFLAAERAGSMCLRWVLAYHAEELAESFLMKIYYGEREDAMIFFHALADQLLPSEMLPPSPVTGITEDTTLYYKKISEWAKSTDLGLLQIHDLTKRPDAAISKASVFNDNGFSSNNPDRIGSLSILLMCIRGLYDAERMIRKPAFNLLRNVLLFILDGKQKTFTDENDINDFNDYKREFADIMSKHALAFSGEGSGTLSIEANEITSYVAKYIKKCDLLTDFYLELFDHYANRQEWGGYNWNADLVKPFSVFVDLTDIGTDEDVTHVSSAGQEFLQNLFRFSCTFPRDHRHKVVSLWEPLLRANEVEDSFNLKDPSKVHPNVLAILDYLLLMTATAQHHVAVCQEIALVCYRIFPFITANSLCYPLSFDFQHGKGGQRLYEDERTRVIQAESSVVLLSGLCEINMKPLMPYMHNILCFSVLHFPSATRFVEGTTRSSDLFRQKYRLTSLLYNMLGAFQPLVMKEDRPNPTMKESNLTNTLIGLIKAGLDVRHLTLDWSKSIHEMSDCLKYSDDLIQDKSAKVTNATAVSGIDPKLFVRDLVEIFSAASDDLASRWGYEVLQWGTRCPEFTTFLKANAIFTALRDPIDNTTMAMLVGRLSGIYADLWKHIEKGKRKNRRQSSLFAAQSVSKVTSTQHYQQSLKTTAVLHSVLVMADTLNKRYKSVSAAPHLFWVAALCLRTAQGHHEQRVFKYGLRLLDALLTNSKTISSVLNAISESADEYTKDWDPEFEGLIPLLVPGLLSEDGTIAEVSRNVALKLLGGNDCLALDADPLSLDIRIMLSILPWLYEQGIPAPPKTIYYAQNLRLLMLKRKDTELLCQALESFLDECPMEDFINTFARWVVQTRLSKIDDISIYLRIAVGYGRDFARSLSFRLAAAFVREAGENSTQFLDGEFRPVIRRATVVLFDETSKYPEYVKYAATSLLDEVARIYTQKNDGNMSDLGDVQGATGITSAFNLVEGQTHQFFKNIASIIPIDSELPEGFDIEEEDNEEEEEDDQDQDQDHGGEESKDEKKTETKKKEITPKSNNIFRNGAPPPLSQVKVTFTSGIMAPPPLSQVKARRRASIQTQTGMTPAQDHPDYQRFFDMRALRIPIGQIKSDMEMEGLDPSVLDFPEKLLPLRK